MTDTLDPGGLERVAVNLANALPRDRFALTLCTTRRGGPLESLLAPDVPWLDLGRRSTIDPAALWKLGRFVRQHHVDVIHAHGTALFVAVAGSCVPPFPLVVWHDHCGHHQTEPRSIPLYRTAAARVSGVVAVNSILADWARDCLRVRHDRVWYVPNFVVQAEGGGARPELPGEPGCRVVCVANMRPQKNHRDLLRAFQLVVQRAPSAHLLLVGSPADAAYAATVPGMIRELSLESSVTLLGERDDVPAILAQCDVGVLSSVSEGFPLVLVEYGLAGLPVVSTDVGQCAEVLDAGRAGSLVAVGDHVALAERIGALLTSPEQRARLGRHLHQRVQERYGREAVIRQITEVYDTVARRPRPVTVSTAVNCRG